MSNSETDIQLRKIEHEMQLPDDPLLACLVYIAKLHHRSITPQALVAGLPLVNNQLTPELFMRAAARAELNAKVVRHDLTIMTNALLPAVLMLKDNQYCVLVDIIEDKYAVIMDPQSGKGSQQISLQDLVQRYKGFAIFVRSEYHFDERTGEALKPREKHWFWGVVTKAWPIYSEVIFASLFINIFALAIPLFIMNVYDRVIPNNAVETLWALAVGVFIAFAFDFLMRNLRAYFIDNSSKNIDVKLSSSIFEQIMGIQMAARPASTGAFANNIYAFENFREFITSATISVIVDVPFILLFMLIIWLIGGPLVWVPVIAAPLIIIVGLLMQIPLNDMVRKLFRFSSEKQAALYEAIVGAETIKTSSAESPMQRKWEQIICFADTLNVKVRFLSSFTINFSVFAQQLSTVLVVIVGVYLISNGTLSMGGLIACTILTGRALAPMSQIAGLLVRYFQSKTALQSLDTVMNLPIERPVGKVTLHKPELSGKIELNNVSFSYPRQKLPALNDVTVKIKPKEHVAFIGRIGSGKTTLGKLLMGLYQPSAGSILFDDIDINQIDPADLRHNIGYVAQDVMLFYGSVKDNITLGAPFIDDEALLAAAQIAGVDKFVKRHPQGFDMPVGERGDKLSGGQRQAISVARALLLKPPVLVMDEPTNSMDEYSEARFREALQKLLPDRTLILTTHKSSMLSLVDRIIILDSGKKIADGSKEDVLTALKEKRIKIPT